MLALIDGIDECNGCSRWSHLDRTAGRPRNSGALLQPKRNGSKVVRLGVHVIKANQIVDAGVHVQEAKDAGLLCQR